MELSSGCTALPLLTLFEELSPTELAHKLQEPLKHQIIEQFGIAKVTTAPQNSTEDHKEVTDKECVRTLLVGLLPTQGEVVVFSEEVQFCLPEGIKGPHGFLDLIVGRNTQQDDGDMVFVCSGDQKTQLKDVFGEAKQEAIPLSGVKRRDTTELGVTAQAAIELLSVSQIAR